MTQAKPSRTRSCRLALQVSATVADSPVAPVKAQNGFEVSEETLSGSRRRITITAPPKTCQKAWQRMIKQARKEVKAPGYRDMKSVRMQALMTCCCTSYLTHDNCCLSSRCPSPLCSHIWVVSWELRELRWRKCSSTYLRYGIS